MARPVAGRSGERLERDHLERGLPTAAVGTAPAMIGVMPFVTSEHDDTDPTIELAVVPPRRFRLLHPFGYRAADGSFWEVPADGTSTDLASVPAPLWSLLASYGHQTRPAILHDHVSELAKATPDRRAAFNLRSRTDRLLRESLAEEGVRSAPRRWTFWAGVTLGKYYLHGTLAARVLGLASLVLLWTTWLLVVLRVTSGVPLPWAGATLVVAAVLWLADPDLRHDWPLWAMALWLAPAFTVYLVVWFLTAVWIGWPGLFTGASVADVVRPTTRAEDR